MEMTIDRAIKTLQKDHDSPGSVPIEDVEKAEEMGVGALQRIKQMRVPGDTLANYPLPGETERRKNGNQRGVNQVSNRV